MKSTKEKLDRPVGYTDLGTSGGGAEPGVGEGHVLPLRTVKPSHQIGPVSRQAVRKVMRRIG